MSLSATFNLVAETEKAVRQYPFLENSFAVIDSTQLTDDNLESPPAIKMTAAHAALLDKNLTERAKNSGAFVRHEKRHGLFLHTLFYHPDNGVMDFVDPEGKYRDMGKLFTFLHELGHVLIPGADDSSYSEAAADAYAAIRILQRDKDKGRELIEKVLSVRAFVAVTERQTSYITSPALEKILDDAKLMMMPFAGLSPNDTVQMARDYAIRFAPTVAQAEKTMDCVNASLCKHYKDEKEDGKIITHLAEVALKTEDALAFRLTAQIFRDLLKPEHTEATEEKRAFLSHLQKRAEDFNLPSLAKSLEEVSETYPAPPRKPSLMNRIFGLGRA